MRELRGLSNTLPRERRSSWGGVDAHGSDQTELKGRCGIRAKTDTMQYPKQTRCRMRNI